ncbi:MAG: ATP-binding protein [Bacteroidales bacterium]
MPVRTTSIRTRLLALALAASLPVVLFAGFMVIQVAADHRDREINDMKRHVNAVAATVNQFLYGATRELTALAVDKDLLSGDIEGAYQEAVAFNAQSSIGAAISLVAPDGRMIFTTARPFGTPLPICSNARGVAETVRLRRPHLSNLFLALVDGRSIATVDVPVIRDDRVDYVLHMEVPPRRIQDILRSQHLYDHWIAIVADRDGAVIASTGGTDGAPGPLIGDGLQQAAATAWAGTYESVGADGVPVMGTFQHMESSDWLVALAVPRTQVDTERLRFLLMLGTSAAAMLAVAAWLTLRMAAQLDWRLREVAGMGNRLGKGLPVEPVVTGIRELDAAAGSLARAATLIASRESDLKRAGKVAHDALASKAKFFAAANHDLRQPVQSLFLFHATLSSMLPEGHPALRPLSYVERSLQALQRLLDGLRDVSRLDAGAVVPVPADVAIDSVLEPLAEEYRLRAADQGLGLRYVPCGLWVRTDPTLLERVVRNLLENAIRYTPTDGRVLLGCRSHSGHVRLQVLDTGIGIPADQLGVIFEEFQQLNNPARDSALGLGLGLAIVRRACDLLGHGISVLSTPGRGSAFTVHLPKVAPPLGG